jgi:L-aspartate oxidase
VIPTSLRAPAPSWERTVDVVVLGSGAAGLSAALAVRPVRSVLVVTKDVLSAGSTAWAQGGLAAVLHPEDSLEEHTQDTLRAGAGLCEESVVRRLVSEAPRSIHYLMRLGAAFDPGDDDQIALTREGGHSRERIVHSGGDRSGAEVQRTLDESAVRAGVEVLERAFAIELLTGWGPDGVRQAAGVLVAALDALGEPVSVGVIRANAVVLASGGYGQVFASTSNPPAVTGDGLAMALRAGLELTDIEFMQFHPTVLWTGADARGQQALISEAVRGEGAVLFDAAGDRIMAGVHPLEDLAPRDVVAAAITEAMARGAAGTRDHVYLDATSIGGRFGDRFPSITQSCLAIGVDPTTMRIPVAPASHYACGGVRAHLDGSTSLRGLYAVGEVTRTGVHGANRLASNSLTEGVVSGTRVGRDLAWELPDRVEPQVPDSADGPSGPLVDPARLVEVRTAMSRHAGVLRDADSLASVDQAVAAALVDAGTTVVPNRASWEATNLATIAAAMVAAATTRTESRGCHRRSDHPETQETWRHSLDVTLQDRSGSVSALSIEHVPLGP